jgi:DNA-binding MarR family transcriptional regulator
MTIDPLSALPGYALRRASAAMLADLGERLAPLDLRPTEASILLLIHANPGITQSKLGRILDIARANMNPIVARLALRNLIAREPVDGRSHGLILTAPGRHMTDAAMVQIAAHEAALLDRIPAHDRTSFTTALGALWQDI